MAWRQRATSRRGVSDHSTASFRRCFTSPGPPRVPRHLGHLHRNLAERGWDERGRAPRENRPKSLSKASDRSTFGPFVRRRRHGQTVHRSASDAPAADAADAADAALRLRLGALASAPSARVVVFSRASSERFHGGSRHSAATSAPTNPCASAASVAACASVSPCRTPLRCASRISLRPAGVGFDLDLAIEPSRSTERAIDRLRSIRGGDDDDAVERDGVGAGAAGTLSSGGSRRPRPRHRRPLPRAPSPSPPDRAGAMASSSSSNTTHGAASDAAAKTPRRPPRSRPRARR